MEQKQFHQAVEEAGLKAYLPQIKKMAEQSIRLTSRPLHGGVSALGASRLGGQPDLAPGISWPVFKSTPMSFVAQVHLADASPYDPTDLLPKQGMLSFFYDSKRQVYGNRPDDRGGWIVLFTPGELRELQRIPFPENLPEAARYQPAALDFSSEITLPYAPRQVFPELDWDEELIRKYEDFRFNFPDAGDYRKLHHRMFGYPEQIQDDMQLQASLMSRGANSIHSPLAQEAENKKNNWLLLLQVDSDETLGMRWGSAGILYYWIEREALKEKKFDSVWLVLQSE
jgi:uncharacterized protein YwqG